jgi:hypothetical protein
MDPKRADPLDIDLSGFGPAPPAKPKVEMAAVRQVSEANDFLSRAPARKPRCRFRPIADSHSGALRTAIRATVFSHNR